MTTQVKDAWLLFTPPSCHLPLGSSSFDDSMAALCRELDALKLQRTIQDELVASKSEKMKEDSLLAKVQRELEELRAQNEVRAQLWCTQCQSSGHTISSCPHKAYCHFCEKAGHKDKECYYLKGFRHLQQQLAPSMPFSTQYPLASSPTFSKMISPYPHQNSSLASTLPSLLPIARTSSAAKQHEDIVERFPCFQFGRWSLRDIR